MNIDEIQNGIVIDHIKAGQGSKLYRLLGLEDLDGVVALIKNVPSNKMGKKDIIKVDANIDVDLNLIGYVDPGVTINVIKDGIRIEKKKIDVPDRLINVIHCKNPRCITTTEQEIKHIFYLSDRVKSTYRCLYCDALAEK